jgi:glucose/arabinose dehydrogenase
MTHGRRALCAAVVGASLLLAACGGGGKPATVATATPSPAPAAAPTVRLPAAPPATGITVPDGFAAFVVAEGFAQPTTVAVGPDGAVYVSQREGPIFRLADTDGDGFFEQRLPVTEEIPGIHGFTFAPDGSVYISHLGTVTVVRDADGDTVGDSMEDVIEGLPHGQHESNGLAFGPDGKLYLTNGSTCNDCAEEDERSAVILQANPDGSDLRVYARGLRNPYDLVFDSRGRLWAPDNGADPPCNTIDELNLIAEGGDYGWPYGPACVSALSGIPPVADLGFNTAATGIDAYDGAHFPAEYRDNLFITLWGSLEYAPIPGGRVLARVVLRETPEGPQATTEDFAAGFDRPIDVAVARDGTLLVIDFGSGTLYRIVYVAGL